MESILTSIKKLLGPCEEDIHFDADLIMHINSVFMILTEMGVGPEEGFSIQDNTATWSDFIPDIRKLEAVKTYVYLKVRLIFDPPQTASVLQALKETIAELEWRLNETAERLKSEEETV